MAQSNSSTPLADFFWIAGVDSISYNEHILPQGHSTTPLRQSLIKEDLVEAKEPDENISRLENNGSVELDKALAKLRDRHSPGDSPQLSNGEHVRQKSVDEFEALFARLSSNETFTDTKRSSQSSTATITVDNVNGTNKAATPASTNTSTKLLGLGLSDQDFDNALRKFATERDNFLEDLSFNAGAVPQPPKRPPPVNPRIQKVNDNTTSPSLMKSGSFRRKLPFKEMNSMKRAPSVANRAASIRTAKRLSNYNSVVQVPEPLNTDPHKHPLKRKFEPVLLDRYPSKPPADNVDKPGEKTPESRLTFPDYVPMFAFPNDVSIISADERPRSTWHGFCMTGGDNSRLYGVCVIIWLPLNQSASEDLEKRCEEWRQQNMSQEERELASSLGERLASERAKLSRLLAQLPYAVADAEARESLDDEINATEEKIGLMTDLLRPVRHGAASKIEGLTDGETGLWIPRAFGILTKEPSLTSFYKEWLKAVVVPMTNGGIQRVPPSSPKIGLWQPLERYVINLCDEAPSPVNSKTQIELAVRELHLYARKEAMNEIPGSRNTDLYALFRCLSLENIVTIFEYCLSEARIIFLSSHTSMLSLASSAIISLLYPFTWAGVYIPVLPARLVSAVEAPCPYIVGVEKRYEKLEIPEDDCVVCDLDENSVHSHTPPNRLPKQQRRKLLALLQLAAPHHNRFGIETGPPPYTVETYPNDSFVAENPSIFTAHPGTSSLAKLVTLPSNAFGEAAVSDYHSTRTPIFNAFVQTKSAINAKNERPGTSGTMKGATPSSPNSPKSQVFPNSLSRPDSGHPLTSTLRSKRSVNFDTIAQRRSSSFGVERQLPNLRRPSAPFNNHSPSPSTSSLVETGSTYNYPPSVYTPSTIAASTIMPQMLIQPVRDSATTKWVEGHCLQWRAHDNDSVCLICDERAEDGIYKCNACNTFAHPRCTENVALPCPDAFYTDQVRAAFVRCFSSLLYTYRRYLQPATGDQKKGGKLYKFNMDGFIRSLPVDTGAYITTLNETQAFNEFIQERECLRADDPKLLLFEQIIVSKKNRGRNNIFQKSRDVSYLNDSSDHLWRSCSAVLPISTRVPGEQRAPFNRIPSRLDPGLMKEPRLQQGVPKIKTGKPVRKPIPSSSGRVGPSNLSQRSAS